MNDELEEAALNATASLFEIGEAAPALNRIADALESINTKLEQIGINLSWLHTGEHRDGHYVRGAVEIIADAIRGDNNT